MWEIQQKQNLMPWYDDKFKPCFYNIRSVQWLAGTIGQNSSYPNQSVTAPQSKFKLADFSLTNNTTEAINLNKIEVDLSINSNPYLVSDYISNLYLVYGNSQTTTSYLTSGNNYSDN